jgi:hypothetical protein
MRAEKSRISVLKDVSYGCDLTKEQDRIKALVIFHRVDPEGDKSGATLDHRSLQPIESDSILRSKALRLQPQSFSTPFIMGSISGITQEELSRMLIFETTTTYVKVSRKGRIVDSGVYPEGVQAFAIDWPTEHTVGNVTYRARQKEIFLDAEWRRKEPEKLEFVLIAENSKARLSYTGFKLEVSIEDIMYWVLVEQIGSSEKSCRKLELIAVLSRK